MSRSQNPSSSEFETNWTTMAWVVGLTGCLAVASLASFVWTPQSPEIPELPPVLALEGPVEPQPPEQPAPDVAAVSDAIVASIEAVSYEPSATDEPDAESSDDFVRIGEVEPPRKPTPAEQLAAAQADFISQYDVDVAFEARGISTDFDPHADVRADARNVQRPSAAGNAARFERMVRDSKELRKNGGGLSFLGEDDCRKESGSLGVMKQIAGTLGGTLASRLPAGRSTIPRSTPSGSSSSRRGFGSPFSGSSMFAAQDAALKLLETKKAWERPEAIPTLVQILQVQTKPLRQELIQVLSRIDGEEATLALADRAMFDPSPDVRELARFELQKRKPGEARDRLLEGLRYPWAPVAAFAAQALLDFYDTESIPHLVRMLDAPDPEEPFRNERFQLVKRELVRLNHMKNCVLCHAPSAATSNSRSDPLLGFVPIPGQAPPVAYYQSRSGSFILASITYLRQDFSLMHDVENAAPWPSWQRFDYVVRTRLLTGSEEDEFEKTIAARKQEADDPPEWYPQRDAVLFALRGLTGVDAGDSSHAWRTLLPRPDPDDGESGSSE